MPHEQAALAFNNVPLHPNDRGNALLRFREQGYTRISNVFEPDTVDAYLEQLKGQVVEGKQWWLPYEMRMTDPLVLRPAAAPRLLDVLRGAFMSWIAEPQPVLMSGGWIVRPANPDPKLVHDWHKDADHLGTSCRQGYTCPTVIHTAIYLTDMTPAHGPTYVVPRSHREASLSPFSGAPEAPLLCDKADVVIWDQRLWHRGSARTVEGLRMVGIFAFYGVPIVGDQVTPCPAQQLSLAAADSPAERVLFGGAFRGGG